MSSFVSMREPAWNDMSDYIVHMTKDYGGETAGTNLSKILQDAKIEERSTFGLAKDRAPDPDSQKAVCFTEMPLTEIKRIAQRRDSKFGLAFSKPFAVMRGSSPIWYACKDHEPASNIKFLVEEAINRNDKDNPIFKIAPFIDIPGIYRGNPYLFEWEREWRKQGDYQFISEELVFIIMPEDWHEGEKRTFSALKQHPEIGRSYDAPIIDVFWKRKKIKQALADAAVS